MGDIFRLYGWRTPIRGWGKIVVYILILIMGYKGQEFGKRGLSAIFPLLHSLKMLPVYCGNISSDVVTALTHCKSFTISPHGLDVVSVALSCVSGP